MLFIHIYSAVGLIVLAFALGLAYRSAVRKHAHTDVGHRPKNIGLRDRLVRAGLGVVLLTVGIVWNWNPFCIFIAGICFFQAAFSWCAWYHLIGKDTCPL